MARRIYHKKSSFSPKLFKFLSFVALVALVVYGGRSLYKSFKFNPQRLVENSILKENTFHADVKEIVSRSGIKAYYFEDKTNPIIALSFRFKNSGSAFDEKGEYGISQMAAALLTEGAGSYSSRRFKDILDEKAISISFDAGVDDFSGAMLTLKQNQKTAARLLKLALTEPRFDDDQIRAVREQLLTLLKQQKEFPDSALSLAWGKEIYGSHPYGRNPVGDDDDIRNIGSEELSAFVKNQLVRKNLIVGIAGDLSEDDAKKLIDQIFGALPESGTQSFVDNAAINWTAREFNLNRPMAQSIATFTAPGVKRSDADFYPIYIANEIFVGQGLTSRLSKALREDRGLTYGVYAYLSIQDKAQLIKGGFSSTADNFDEAKALLIGEWVKMGKEGVSEEELEQAKSYLISSYNLRFASLPNIAETLVAMQEENLGSDFLIKRNQYIQDVTLEQVNNAARKYFDANRLIWVNFNSTKQN